MFVNYLMLVIGFFFGFMICAIVSIGREKQ
jgi:hypothetical protein